MYKDFEREAEDLVQRLRNFAADVELAADMPALVDSLRGSAERLDAAVPMLAGNRDTQASSRSKVPRLDFSKPPPGYSIEEVPGPDGGWRWRHNGETNTADGPMSKERAAAAAWAHHKARRDPPGMRVASRLGRWEVLFIILPGWPSLRPFDNEFEARAAAWAWHEDALEVANKVDALLECPHCDNREPTVEHFDDGTCSQPWCTAEMPEVLRG